jgi:hypothetical protein
MTTMIFVVRRSRLGLGTVPVPPPRTRVGKDLTIATGFSKLALHAWSIILIYTKKYDRFYFTFNRKNTVLD